MNERRFFLAFVDAMLINVAVVLAFAVWALRGDLSVLDLISTQFYWFVFLTTLWLIFETLGGAFDLSVVVQLQATTRALLQTFFLVLLAYVAIFFFIPTELPRGIVFYHGIFTVILIALWRALYLRLAPRAQFRRRALIVGAGWAGQTVAQAIQADFGSYYDLLGFVDDDPAKQKTVINGLTVLGGRAQLVNLVREQRVTQIILAITRNLAPELFQELMNAQELGIEIIPMPLLYEQITGRVPVEHIGNSWYLALPLGEDTATIYALALKRLFDIVVSALGLLGFGLLLPIIAVAIRLDSRGDVFYSQLRVGQGGKSFAVRKLRTMVTDAEPNGQAVWAVKNDPRITRVGRILRKLHLDELPQFWNVLRGEMSIVGPRPERPEFVEQLEKQIPFYRLRHSVKPGMAGWALINAGYADSVDDAHLRVEYDLYYIKHQSIWLDFWILFRTALHMLAFRGQ